MDEANVSGELEVLGSGSITVRVGSIVGQVSCPFCGSEHTSVTGLFSSTLSEIPMWCRTCSSVFSWFRWQQDIPERVAGQGTWRE
jgi:transposase-like protein